MDNSLQPAND